MNKKFSYIYRDMRTVFKILAFTTIAVSTAFGISSCSKHETDPADPIRLGLSSVGTKAAINNLPELIAQSYNGGTNSKGFGVYGYKTVRNTQTSQDTPTRLFNNTEVTHTTGNAETLRGWTYRHTRYWDSNPNASYQFVAYWPRIVSDSEPDYEQNTTDPYVSENNKTISLHNVPNWQYGGAADDYMIATSFGPYNAAGGYKDNSGYVEFTFTHMLAQLEVRGFYTGTRNDTITVTGFEVVQSADGNQDALTDGSTDFSLAFNQSGESVVEGANNNGPDYGISNYILRNAEIGIRKSSFAQEGSNTPIDTMIIANWLMVPHQWDSTKLRVSYKIGQDGMEKASEPLTIKWINNPDNYTLAAGSKYKLILKFNSAGQGITIESVLVSDWIEEKVSWGVHTW